MPPSRRARTVLEGLTTAADGAASWLTHPGGRRWLLRGLLVYAVVGFCVWIRRPGDFAGYLFVGDLVLSGRHIYLDAPVGMNTWPPFFSLFCVPLAVLAAPTPYLARGVWVLLNFACLWLVLRWLARLVYDRTLSLRAETEDLSLASPELLVPLLLVQRYVSGNLDHLQINLVMFTLALGGLFWQATRREIAGSLLLGLAAAMKVMSIVFIPYLVYRRRWRAALCTAVATAAWSLSPILVFGWDRFWEYVATWRAALAVGWGVGKMNQSVFAMWDRFIGHGMLPLTAGGVNFVPSSGDPAVIVAVGGTLAVIAGAVLWTFRGQPAPRWATGAEWSVVFIVGALFGPVTWKAYLVVLWLPATLLFAAWRSPALDPHRRRVAGRILVVFFVLGTVLSRAFVGKTLGGVFEMTSTSTLAALVLLGGSLWLRAHLPNAEARLRGGPLES